MTKSFLAVYLSLIPLSAIAKDAHTGRRLIAVPCAGEGGHKTYPECLNRVRSLVRDGICNYLFAGISIDEKKTSGSEHILSCRRQNPIPSSYEVLAGFRVTLAATNDGESPIAFRDFDITAGARNDKSFGIPGLVAPRFLHLLGDGEIPFIEAVRSAPKKALHACSLTYIKEGSGSSKDARCVGFLVESGDILDLVPAMVMIIEELR